MRPAVAAAAVAGPSVGPAIVTLFGVDIPVFALSMSVAGLMLARVVAPPPLRKLTRAQECALTCLLLLVLFLLVTGLLSACTVREVVSNHECTARPLKTGMATVWGIGLGFSGLLAIEFFGGRVMRMLRVLFGTNESGKSDD